MTDLLPVRAPERAPDRISRPLLLVDDGWRWLRLPLLVGVPLTTGGTAAMWWGTHSPGNTAGFFVLSTAVYTWVGLADELQCDHVTPTGQDTADACPSRIWVWGTPYGQVRRAARRGWLRGPGGWRCGLHPVIPAS